MTSFAKCDSGATAIEYGLIAGLVSIGFIATLMTSGDNIAMLYDSIAAQVVAALSST